MLSCSNNLLSFFLLVFALSLLYAIVNCLILYLTQSKRTAMSSVLSSSPQVLSISCLISVLYFSSCNRLMFNFHKPGPLRGPCNFIVISIRACVVSFNGRYYFRRYNVFRTAVTYQKVIQSASY